MGCFYKRKPLLGFRTVFLTRHRLDVLHIFPLQRQEFWGLSSYLSLADPGFCTDSLLRLLFIKSELSMCYWSLFSPLRKRILKSHDSDVYRVLLSWQHERCVSLNSSVIFAVWQKCLQPTNVLCTVQTFSILWLYVMKLPSLITWEKMRHIDETNLFWFCSFETAYQELFSAKLRSI